RGPTHSFLLLPFWALAFSWILARLLREPGGWRALYGVTALGIALHIVGDLITNFGTMILWPLTTWRPGLGTTFIIDPWFTGIILAGLIAALFLRRKRFPSVAALATLCAYVGFQYVVKQQALEFGAEYARSHGIAGARIDAHPRPASPFNWTVFVSDEEAHRFAHVNLVRDKPKPYQPGDGFFARLDAAYLPPGQAVWVTRTRYGQTDQALIREAWESPPLGFFRWFAELPAFDGMTAKPDCTWFVDLRFLIPGRNDLPFEFGACREAPDRPWRAYQRDAIGKGPVR
ncbi:MAG: metal-dependent hydrolase, partial [Betaproteobacteria bacterium]|nr:metal-dependent hydrolase [Betaproteobacteria bacterium]